MVLWRILKGGKLEVKAAKESGKYKLKKAEGKSNKF